MQKNNPLNQRLLEMRAAKDILLASHSGYYGVDIVNNTVDSFDIAIRLGADIVEMDLSMSADGELFVFHAGMEPRILRSLVNIQTLPASVIRQLTMFNLNGGPARGHVNTFDEVLESLKGRCLLNLDKCWTYPDEHKKWSAIFDAVERHNMADQIIFKSEAEPKYADMFSQMDRKYMYMPMLNCQEDIKPFQRDDINMVMVEVKFKHDDDPFGRPEVIHGLQQQGYMVWGNAINLSCNWCLSAGHDDYTALMGDPDKGWGYFIDRGYDILQTDHLPVMIPYLKQRGVRL